MRYHQRTFSLPTMAKAPDPARSEAFWERDSRHPGKRSARSVEGDYAKTLESLQSVLHVNTVTGYSFLRLVTLPSLCSRLAHGA